MNEITNNDVIINAAGYIRAPLICCCNLFLDSMKFANLSKINPKSPDFSPAEIVVLYVIGKDSGYSLKPSDNV